MLEHVLNGQTIRIQGEGQNVRICLTDMAKAVGKEVYEWLRLPTTEAYLSAYTRIAGKSRDTLVTKVRGNVRNAGTWADRKVAIRFAQWCNQDFAIQVDLWVDELMSTGKVELKDSIDSTTGELKNLQQQYEELEEKLEDVKLQALLWEERAYQVIDVANEKLDAAEKDTKYYSDQLDVYQRKAREGGKAAGMAMKYRLLLGEYIAKGTSPARKAAIKKEYEKLNGG